MNQLTTIQASIRSTEIAEMMDMKHYQILEKLEGTKTVKGIIPILGDHKIMVSDYFIESTYKTEGNSKTYKCYECTKMGCEFLANKFTGEKGILFTAKYVKRFNEMEQAAKENKAIVIDKQKQQLAEAKLNNSKARQAKILLQLADKNDIPEYRQILHAYASEIVTGQKILPLPKAERRTYSATEIGEKIGISSKKVGSIANKHNLKTDEYGIYVWDKSSYSSKQVQSFRYYENVITAIESFL